MSKFLGGILIADLQPINILKTVIQQLNAADAPARVCMLYIPIVWFHLWILFIC